MAMLREILRWLATPNFGRTLYFLSLRQRELMTYKYLLLERTCSLGRLTKEKQTYIDGHYMCTLLYIQIMGGVQSNTY